MLSRLSLASCRQQVRLRVAFSSTTKDVLLSRSDNGVFATITINRPQVHNCLSPSVMEGLNSALNELKGEGNDKLRAVFLKAEGQTFCAGGDLKVGRPQRICVVACIYLTIYICST